MAQSTQPSHLIVIYRPKLTLGWSSCDPGDRLVVDGTLYKSKVDSDFTGFYDRMYDSAGRFIGFQILPLVAEQYLSQALSRFAYVRPTRGVLFRVFLAGPVNESPRIVDDQGFGGRIYEAIDGEFAMSFDTAWMSQADVEAIREASAEWIEVAQGSALMSDQ
jgi:hypothetical protein